MSGDRTKDVLLIALLIWLLWPKSGGGAVTTITDQYGNPITGMVDGAKAIDSQGRCYQWMASANSWYPC